LLDFAKPKSGRIQNTPCAKVPAKKKLWKLFGWLLKCVPVLRIHMQQLLWMKWRNI